MGHITNILQKIRKTTGINLQRLRALALRLNLALGRFGNFVLAICIDTLRKTLRGLWRLRSALLRVLIYLRKITRTLAIILLLAIAFGGQAIALISGISRRFYKIVLEGGALAGVVFLVYETVYGTTATVSSPPPGPIDPFYYPFSITNTSHLFTLRNIEWRCHDIFSQYGRITSKNNIRIYESVSKIRPGDTLNIPCRIVSGITPTAVTMQVDLVYDVDARLIIFRRCPSAFFTWTSGTANPQWIKGDWVGNKTPYIPAQKEGKCKTFAETQKETTK